MITLYPDNRDWDAMAQLTGDQSWTANAMRGFPETMGLEAMPLWP